MTTQVFPAALAGRPAAIDELSDIVLTSNVDAGHDRVLPEGSRGTVMSVHAGGEAYTVEFEQPFHALVLLYPWQVNEIPDATRGYLAGSAR